MPLGFKFCPTDEQLVIHYLTPKEMNGRLPQYYIQEISNPFERNPLEFPGLVYFSIS